MPVKIVLKMSQNATTDQNDQTDQTDLGEASGSINAAAHAYQVAMEENNAGSALSAPSLSQTGDSLGDVVMSDNVSNQAASPAIIPSATPNADSPAPHRIGTPLRATNGNDATSRATSQHPEPAPAQAFPKKAAMHGAPTRQYLNSKVTTTLLEGMKLLAKDQPADPLRVLGEFLLQKSRELEGT